MGQWINCVRTFKTKDRATYVLGVPPGLSFSLIISPNALDWLGCPLLHKMCKNLTELTCSLPEIN